MFLNSCIELCIPVVMHLFELVDKNANYLVDHSYFVGNHQIGLLIQTPFLSSISDFAVNPY